MPALEIPGNWLLLFGAGVMLYVASRAGAGAGVAHGESAPVRRALGHWLVIAAVAVVAVVRGEGLIALGVIFSTSVGCLGLILGLTAAQAPLGPGSAGMRRAWGFVLPAGVLVVLIGLRTSFSLLHALLLAVQGLVIVMAAQAAPEAEDKGTGADEDPAEDMHEDSMADGHDSEPSAARNREPADPNPQCYVSSARRSPLAFAPSGSRLLTTGGTVMLAALVAAIGAWMVTDAAVGLDERTRIPLEVWTTGAVSALLILPVLGAATSLVHRRIPAEAGDVQVCIVLLNLCVLLPGVIVLWTLLHDQPLVFPMRMWRVDAIVLVVLGLLLLPVALGRWRLGRPEGVALVIGFGAYLMAASWLATR